MEVLESIPGIPTHFTTQFTMDYTPAKRPQLARLYEKAKKEQWNASTDVDWSIEVDPVRENFPDTMIPIYGTPLWKGMDEEKRQQLRLEAASWILSQFLHGEQGALIATAQLVNTVPWYDAKLYASTQVVDEGRHVEVFNRYIRDKLGVMYPVDPNLMSILDGIVSDPRWDVKYLGMQILVEGLALSAFNLLGKTTKEPLIRDIVRLTAKDESRHVAFGIISLEGFYSEMSREEARQREEFAYNVSVALRDRFLGAEVARRNHIPEDVWTRHSLDSKLMQEFRQLLFSRIMPSLKRIGILSDEIKPKFESLGLLKYQDAPIDFTELD